MNRVAFIVDGFNLYHTLKRANQPPHNKHCRWLDLSTLCRNCLPTIGKNTQLADIHYISALAVHLQRTKPGVTFRHEQYIRCLKDSGVQVLLNRFKKKSVWCNNCKTTILKHEEKETDVMLATTLFELFHKNLCDTAVLVTGDTDLVPAVNTGKKLFPEKNIIFAFPFGTQTKEMKALAPGSFTLSPEAYVKAQFPNPYLLADGSSIAKPAQW
ncbi:MAG: NYN domain-containing protein [Chlorobium sp.]|uniref:NYN domain-containing protein n=1 Tax=Chlorobium sp. TaxID=1095 RepID=UPI002F41B62D